MSKYRFEDDDWLRDVRDANRAGMSVAWRVVIWIVVALIVAGLIGWGIWALNVATSGVRGQGDGIVQRNSAENWLDAQARFVENYELIVAADKQIAAHAEALAKHPEDRILQTNYTGSVNACLSIVADYNADAQNFLREDFRSADLPERITGSDPATDCHE